MSDLAPVSHPHEYYVDLVTRAPKISEDELTPYERENGHMQFGNNFFYLFSSRLKAERSADPQEYRRQDRTAQFYLVVAETTYAQQWGQFLDHNQDLVKQIDAALEGVFVYQEMNSHLNDLYERGSKKGDFSCSEAVAFGDLGVELAGVYAWRQLNPLLEEAANKMQGEGINLQVLG